MDSATLQHWHNVIAIRIVEGASMISKTLATPGIPWISYHNWAWTAYQTTIQTIPKLSVFSAVLVKILPVLLKAGSHNVQVPHCTLIEKLDHMYHHVVHVHCSPSDSFGFSWHSNFWAPRVHECFLHQHLETRVCQLQVDWLNSCKCCSSLMLIVFPWLHPFTSVYYHSLSVIHSTFCGALINLTSFIV